jgi:membrane-bound lytic murein transglycosylase A
MSDLTRTPLDFADLNGWATDDHRAALAVFLETADACPNPAVRETVAASASDPRGFFETLFAPVLVSDGKPGLFTGYFEPEIDGALNRGGRFNHPIYGLPPELDPARPWLTRREIEERGALAGRGLEIAWLADPVDHFFLQVQGSGRIRLPDGTTLRVGFAGKNGHPYHSIGKELVRRGAVSADRISAQTTRDWIRANPDAGQALLWTNPSYVFFRRINDVSSDRGPIGTMGCPVTPLRSIAVDPAFTPLGTPVWIEMADAPGLHRLMVAQDTGSAIIGPQRADVFFGTGDVAGARAGAVRAAGRMIALLPRVGR